MNLGYGNVATVCATVDLNLDKPAVDLSRVTFLEPFALVYLGMFLRYHNSQGKSFRLKMPTAQPARDYLATQNFWRRFNFKVAAEKMPRHVNSTSMNDIIDIERTPEVGDELGQQAFKLIHNTGASVQAGSIAEAISELVDNFSQHSGQILAACMMQCYPQAHRVAFAIGDCGMGIRASLCSNQKYAYLKTRSHGEAAVKAFEPLVSRKVEGGMGLTQVREEIVRLNGRLFLSTGDAYVMIAPGTAIIGKMAYNLPGVQIELSFPEGK